jgi:hypothetical protein
MPLERWVFYRLEIRLLFDKRYTLLLFNQRAYVARCLQFELFDIKEEAFDYFSGRAI